MVKNLLLTTIFLMSLLIPVSVEAHVLKVNGNIGAVLHVDPDDDPFLNQPTNFYFEFKDKENKLNLEKCDCNVNIVNDLTNDKVYDKPLFNKSKSASLNSPTFDYTFTSKAVYTVTLTGKPVEGADFQNFKLEYDIRVNKDKNGNSNLSYFLVLIPATIFVILIFLIFKFKNK